MKKLQPLPSGTIPATNISGYNMQHHALIGENRAIRLDYPNSWDELTRSQAIYAGNLLYLLSVQELEVDQFRKLMVDKFIRRDNNHNDKLSFESSMDMWANEGQLADTVNFFFQVTQNKKGADKYELQPTGIENTIPWLKKRGRKYYGPHTFLNGMTFLQFKDALTCTTKYMETMDEQWLTRLTAVCYLPKGEKYNSDTVDRREKRFKRINTGIKYMCFCYLMGCMHNLKTDADGHGIEIDGNPCYFSYIFNKKAGSGGESVGLTGVLMSLAESGVFGTIKETADADVWDVLTRLYQLELQNRELEKSMKK